MEESLNEKHQKARLWLEKMYGDQIIPQYEINERTVEILYQLALRNEQMERDTKCIIEDLQHKTGEYGSEAVRINQVLSCIGLPLNSLSQSGLMSLKALANLAVLLGLRDCKMSSFLLGLSEHTQEVFSLQQALADEKRLNSKLQTKTRKAVMKSNSLKQSLQILDEQKSLQKPVVEKRIRDAKFFKAKVNEYRNALKELEEYKKQVGLDPSLYHEAIVKKSDDITDLRQQVKDLKAILAGYHSLPPNISLAKVKLEEAKREFDKLEETLSTNINFMNM